MKISFKKKFLLVAIISLLFTPLVASIAKGSEDLTEEDLTETAKLIPASGVGGYWFGYAVGISGDTAVTAASLTKTTSSAAYVFTGQQNGEWTKDNLTIPAIFPGIFSVAASGDTVVFGDPASGSVYVFRKLETGEWSREDLTKPNVPSFGWSVAIDGNTLVVGAPFDSNGSAYVFTRNGSTWAKHEPPLTPDEPTNRFFGHSVAIAGNTVVVGAPLSPFSPSEPGSAYVFSFDDSTWEEEQILTTDNEEAGDYFGAALAIDGDALVVGAPQFLPPFTMETVAPGSAHVFKLDADNNWHEHCLLPSEAAGFGSSVAIDGNRVVVGAPCDGYKDKNAGSAQVYSISEKNPPKLEQRLLASDGVSGDQLGWSVAMDGSTVLVGALNADDQVENLGAVYVYTLSQPLVAYAGEDQVAVEDHLVELVGSSDPDDDEFTFEWEQIGEPEVVLYGANTKTPNFFAPPVEDGCIELTFQLTVKDGDVASDSDEVVIRVFPNNEIHGKLGGKHRHWLYWHKYTFEGSDGDPVTIKLEADPDGWHRGDKATLILKDKIKGVRLLKTKTGNLPIDLSTTLQADGTYAVYVFKNPWCWFRRHKSFEGDYILTLEGTCGRLVKGYKCKRKRW